MFSVSQLPEDWKYTLYKLTTTTITDETFEQRDPGSFPAQLHGDTSCSSSQTLPKGKNSFCGWRRQQAGDLSELVLLNH